MVIELPGRPETGLTQQAWDSWLAHLQGKPAGSGGGAGGIDIGSGLGGGDWGYGAGGLVDVGQLDTNTHGVGGGSLFDVYDFPTWGGGGFVGGVGGLTPIDGPFGPGGIFGLVPPPAHNHKPAPSRLDLGGWRKPNGNLGAFQPGNKTEGGSNAPPAPMPIRPLHKDGKPDFRFEAKLNKREQFFPDFPGGTRTITLESTNERAQQFLTFHADPRLVAANRGPSPAFGTPVADITTHGDLSGTRHAPLQSALRVVKSPRRSVKSGQTSDQAPGEFPNCLALNIGTTGLGETIGLLATDNSYGRNRHGRLTRADGGTWAIGPMGCKHRLGTDGDNDPILPMHIPCEALFSFDDGDAIHDGPIAFNPIPIGNYEARSGYTYRVDPCWDPGWLYVSGAASYRGAFAFRVQVPMGVTTPTEKPPPPDKPPPSTPGGGDPPGRGGPTTGGGGNPAPTPGGGNQPQTNTARGIGASGSSAGAFGGDKMPPRVVAQNGTRVLLPRDHAAMAPALGLSAMVFRPRLMVEGVRDLAYGLDATMDELERFEQTTPAALRLEVYGRQGGNEAEPIFGGKIGPDFIRTQSPNKSTHRGGTVNGGAWLFPPELGLEDADTGAVGDDARPTSTSFFGLADGVRLGFGVPDVASGGMRGGYAIRGNAGELSFRQFDDNAAETDYLTMLQSGQVTWTGAKKWSFENTDGMMIGATASQKIGFFGTAPSVQSTGWSIGSMGAPRKTFDFVSGTAAEVREFLATLATELLAKGVIGS